MQVREADGLHRVRVPGAVQCVCACTRLAHQLARLIGRCACRHASVQCLWLPMGETDGTGHVLCVFQDTRVR